MNKQPRVTKSASKSATVDATKTAPTRAARKPAVTVARRPVAAKAAPPKVAAAAKPAAPARKAAPTKSAPSSKAGSKPAQPKPVRIKKVKLVEAKFTLPESEYKMLGQMKKACTSAGFAVKKSELFRVGMALLNSLDQAALQRAVDGLAPLKVARPKKDA